MQSERDQYKDVCEPKFGEISTQLSNIDDRTRSIENKIYNGFSENIEGTKKRTERIEERVENLQRLIISLILTAAGGAIGIIVSVWVYL